MNMAAFVEHGFFFCQCVAMLGQRDSNREQEQDLQQLPTTVNANTQQPHIRSGNEK